MQPASHFRCDKSLFLLKITYSPLRTRNKDEEVEKKATKPVAMKPTAKKATKEPAAKKSAVINRFSVVNGFVTPLKTFKECLRVCVRECRECNF